MLQVAKFNTVFPLLIFPTFSIDEKVGKKSRPWSILQIEQILLSTTFFLTQFDFVPVAVG